MTVLSACAQAAIVLTGRPPTALFSSSGQFERELQYLANEAARAIAAYADWQALTRLHTIAGDGTTGAFPLPGDYDRFPVAGAVYSTRSTWPLRRVRDLNQWLDFGVTGMTGSPGCWIILGGQMQFRPSLASGDSAKFYYISSRIVSGNKTAFTDDGDSFVLPERLLTLALIWRWRSLKRLEYAEDLRNYEIALSEAAGRDKARGPLAVGRARIPSGAAPALAGSVGNASIDASSGSITADHG